MMTEEEKIEAEEIIPEVEDSPIDAPEDENLSEENKAKIEKYGVKNPKGRVASVLSLILWSILLIMLIVKGDWSIGPILMAVLFILLLMLTGVRLIQEWKENGDWLDN
jgi:Flp pilus assembly protein TadB